VVLLGNVPHSTLISNKKETKFSSVDMEMGYRLGGRCSNPDKGKDSSAVYNVQSVPGAHPIVY
jgi:hypothetical protein